MILDAPVQAEAALQQGFALHRQGRLGEALTLYQRALELQPQQARGWHLMGVAALQSNQAEAAVQLIERAISLAPTIAEYHDDYGSALFAINRHDAAIASYSHAIALQPQYVDAYFNRGNALYKLRRFDAAITDYDRAIALRPEHPGTYNNRALALAELNRPEAALRSFDQALTLNPHYDEAYCNRGNLLLGLGQLEAALSHYDRAIAIKADMPEAHMNRGVALRQLQKLEAALASYDRAIAINPNYAAAHANRGVVLKDLKAWDAALASFDRAVELDPASAETHTNRGELFKELKQWPAALLSYERAIAIDPAYAEAYYGRGETQRILEQYAAAAASLGRALELKPEMKCLFGNSLYVRMHLCDWQDFDANLTELSARIERREPACLPHPFSALSGSPALQMMAADIWVREEWAPSGVPSPISKYRRRDRIRIGYFSGDFRNHPVSILSAELYELHDRGQFDVSAFSFGPDTQDAMRQRLQWAFDRFIDVRGHSDQDVAALARSMELDIAVDLAGFTGEARPKIFATRAAPLQVSYLGYLGTMAAPYMDYLIADATLVPPEYRRYYTEKLLYLPSYQANDSKRRIAEKSFTRQELGLPPQGFVFCCFNASYKITPSTFNGWMRILQRVPGSVLLLYAGSDEVRSNLRAEAKRRGIDAARLVFGPAMPAPEYLARYRTADLFLDTLPYNAGTTASDALWAGLPVLTCAGEAFASRMAASLLTAVGLPELITVTQDQYEDLAVAVGSDPARMESLKRRLAANRLTTPLFDSQAFTRHLERAYQSIYDRYQAGMPPEDEGVDGESGAILSRDGPVAGSTTRS